MVSQVLMTWVQIGGGIVVIIGLFYLSVGLFPKGARLHRLWCGVSAIF
jgi:hypothetical protein